MVRIPKFLLASVAVLGTVLADGAGHQADALQCVYNHFGKSLIAVEVKWLDAGTNAVVKKEKITAGQTSCADNFTKTRAVSLRVIGSEAADVITKTSIFVGASVLGVALGVVTGGVGAAVVGASEAAIGTAITVGATAGEIIVGTGAEVGAAFGLDPKEHIDFVGLPSHYFYLNVGGTVWKPWAESGNAIKPFDIPNGKDLILTHFTPMPLFHEAATPTAMYQNVTLATCAFMCASQGIFGCGGYNYQVSNSTKMMKLPNGVSIPVPMLANQCSFFTKDVIARQEPTFDAKNSAEMFYKLR